MRAQGDGSESPPNPLNQLDILALLGWHAN
jgi:hypothetical protein